MPGLQIIPAIYCGARNRNIEAAGEYTSSVGGRALCGSSFGRCQQVLQPLHAHPRAIVAKAFGLLTLADERFQEWKQRRYDLLQWNQVLEHEIQPIAERPAADEEGELVAAAADDADIALIRAGAAVGAASHSHGELLVGQSEPGQFRFQSIDDAGQSALGFGECQATGGDRRTSHAQFANSADLVRAADAKFDE